MATINAHVQPIRGGTQKARILYVRAAVNTLGECMITPQHDYFAMFDELMQRHHNRAEKIGCGIASFEIGRSRWGGFTLYIHRTDGSRVDVSWRHCCTGRAPTPRSCLLTAMRYAILCQTNATAHSQKLVCAHCGMLTTRAMDCQVDHKNPAFATLADDFIAETTYRPTVFDDDPDCHTCRFQQTVADQEFSTQWKAYHADHAVLQVLCVDCHTRKRKINDV